MELIIAENLPAAIRWASAKGWTRRHGTAPVWDRGGGELVRYCGTRDSLSGWPKGTRLHEVPGVGGSEVWAEAHRLVVLGRFTPY